MKTWVFEGWIESINDDDTFTVRVERKDEIIFAEIWNHEIREEDRKYIKEGACLTWYVTEKCSAIRFCIYTYKPSDILRAKRQAREWMEMLEGSGWFSEDVPAGSEQGRQDPKNDA
jgi:hypothetical protein